MTMKLRQSAEERIDKGTAPATRGWPTGMQALTLLHGLASEPDTASDALKLLHELQVHQVELDLQHEQAEQDRRELTENLANSAALFDLAPFAYLTLEREGLVGGWHRRSGGVGRSAYRRPAGARVPRGRPRHVGCPAQRRGPAILRGAIQGRWHQRARRGHCQA